MTYHIILLWNVLVAFIETKPGSTEKVNMNENAWYYCPAINNLRLYISYQVSSHFAIHQMFVMLNIDRRWPLLDQAFMKTKSGNTETVNMNENT